MARARSHEAVPTKLTAGLVEHAGSMQIALRLHNLDELPGYLDRYEKSQDVEDDKQIRYLARQKPRTTYHATSDGIILYIVIQLENKSDVPIGQIVDRIVVLQRRFLNGRNRNQEFNHGYQPIILVTGHGLPSRDHRIIADAGAMLFDLDQPSNEKFQSPEELVARLEQLGTSGLEVKVDVTMPPNSVDADPSPYYKPVTENDSEALSRLLQYLNQRHRE